MHIPRKPAEQIEVDWAGDPVHRINQETGEMVPVPVNKYRANAKGKYKKFDALVADQTFELLVPAY